MDQPARITPSTTSSQNLIVTIDGISYDLTSYGDSHPGGRTILERAAEMSDAGQLFHDVGHSESALRLRESFKVTSTSTSTDADAMVLAEEGDNGGIANHSSNMKSLETDLSSTLDSEPATVIDKRWIKHLVIVAISLAWAVIVLLTSQSGAGFYSDWIRQYPYAGQSGHGEFLIRGASGVSMDYPWRLATPSRVGTILAWVLCVLHVLGQWLVLYFASVEKDKQLVDDGMPRYTDKFTKWNYFMMAVNLLGIGLGFIHKQFYYDGLAGTLSESVAQNAVVFYLSVVLLMETPRRGMFFHRGRGYFCFSQDVQTALLSFLKRYHGYLFSLAFTVNYHYQAIESTSSHFFGYFYQMLLILQGTLLFNHAHKDRGWTFWLESLVLLHAVGVAAIQNIRALCMFTFGFSLVTMVTQIWGLPYIESILFPPELEEKRTKMNVIVPALVMLLWIIPVTVCGVLGYFPAFTAVLIPVGLLFTYVSVALLFWVGYKLYHKFGCADGWAAKVFQWTYGVAATVAVFVISVALVGGAAPGLYKFATPQCGMVFFENGTNATLAPPNTCFV